MEKKAEDPLLPFTSSVPQFPYHETTGLDTIALLPVDTNYLLVTFGVCPTQE